MGGDAGKGASEVCGIEQVVEAGVEAGDGIDGFAGVEGAHVGFDEGDGAARGADLGLVEHGGGEVDADDLGSAVGLEDGMDPGAAGEVDEGFWAADVGVEALVDAGGDEDGVFEAVEALPSVVDFRERGVGGWVAWGLFDGALLVAWGLIARDQLVRHLGLVHVGRRQHRPPDQLRVGVHPNLTKLRNDSRSHNASSIVGSEAWYHRCSSKTFTIRSGG